MVDIGKQIAHWRFGAKEDWEVACQLLDSGRIRHSLFFAHLTLEKTLKGLYCQTNNDLAPSIHNLLRLAEGAHLSLTDNQRNLLAEVNSYNIEGRYPELLLPQVAAAEAKACLTRIERLLTCLNQQF
jgi:HEPN domain-containing protein